MIKELRFNSRRLERGSQNSEDLRIWEEFTRNTYSPYPDINPTPILNSGRRSCALCVLWTNRPSPTRGFPLSTVAVHRMARQRVSQWINQRSFGTTLNSLRTTAMGHVRDRPTPGFPLPLFYDYVSMACSLADEYSHLTIWPICLAHSAYKTPGFPLFPSAATNLTNPAVRLQARIAAVLPTIEIAGNISIWTGLRLGRHPLPGIWNSEYR